YCPIMYDIIAHTDGACKKTGHGGWSVLIQLPDLPGQARYQIFGSSEADTTNNRMELSGPLQALIEAYARQSSIQIISDSQYFVNGYNAWMNKWKRKGWRISELKPLKNVEYW